MLHRNKQADTRAEIMKSFNFWFSFEDGNSMAMENR